jgi:hypothetical protein
MVSILDGVKIAFLNALVEKKIYINHPRGFEGQGHETHVCRLKKALYSMPGTPRLMSTF